MKKFGREPTLLHVFLLNGSCAFLVEEDEHQNDVVSFDYHLQRNERMLMLTLLDYHAGSIVFLWCFFISPPKWLFFMFAKAIFLFIIILLFRPWINFLALI